MRELIEANPADAYAHLMPGRRLERQSRHDEAGRHLRLADAMATFDR